MNYYYFNGMTVSSEIELAILPVASKALTCHKASVYIQLDKVPDKIDKPIKQTPTYQINHTQVLIKLPTIGRFLIEHGTRITIEANKHCKHADLCTFILGVVWAPLSYQQGKSLLKGALVSIDSQNWLLSGSSPIGISTVALAMQKYCGAQIISDEFCSYQTDKQGILINEGVPALKLWQRSLEHFELNNQSLVKVRTQLNKYWLPITNTISQQPTKKLPLHGIINLKEWRSDEISPIGIKQVTGFKALKKTYQHSFHPAYIKSQANLKHKFQQDLQLVQCCKIASFTFKRDFASLQASCHNLHQWITHG